jgi:glycosyltransferase involved in cell wall biosynthesis
MATSKKVLVLAHQALGGISTFCRDVFRDDPHAEVMWYRDGEQTGFDRNSGAFLINRFDKLDHVYRLLREHLELHHFDVLVGNEGFEWGLFSWWAPTQPVCGVVHLNNDHAYTPALRYSPWIDRFFCVSDTSCAYLQARGLRQAETFRYSTFIDVQPSAAKRRKVIYAGRFHADKNLLETARLFRLFKERGYEVRMIGGGPLEAELRALLPNDVLTNVPRERLLREIDEASFLCLNSYIEGLPIVYSEAMHFRLGVICNYVDRSAAEVLGDNFHLNCGDEALCNWMESFRFRPPSGGVRVNDPQRNADFLAAVRGVAKRLPARESRPPDGILDRLPWLPNALVSRLRHLRWNGRRKQS